MKHGDLYMSTAHAGVTIFMVIKPNNKLLPDEFYYTCIVFEGSPFVGNLHKCESNVFTGYETYIGNMADLAIKAKNGGL